jgi:hypothetical protein
MSLELPAQTRLSAATAAVLLMLFVLKGHLLFLHNVNWDEFLFLAKVHAALRGDLTSALQTVYVHAFTWLPSVSTNEVEQVIAARSVMLALQAATCGLIYLVARTLFASAAAALAGALVYVSFAYTLDHGTAFRADPIAAVLLMLALWMIVRERGGRGSLIFAGALAALAGMVTIKAVFYVPTLVIATFCLRGEKNLRAHVAEVAVFAAAAGAAFLVFYVMHRNAIALGHGYSASGMVARSADKVIRLDQLFPARRYLEYTLKRDAVSWLLVVGGVAAASTLAMARSSRRRGIGLLALGMPLLSVVFYRNAFPYYYVFMLAGPAVLASGLIAWVEARSLDAPRGRFRVAYGLVLVVLSASVLERYTRSAIDGTLAQRQLVETVHRIFPEPVPYIDRVPIISSFPKAGFFMSTWGVENYLQAENPIMRDLLLRQRPVFLIANVFSLAAARPGGRGMPAVIAEDVAVLRSHYVPHWGPVWVAGKKIELQTAAVAVPFEVLVPGAYTLEGEIAVNIDGVIREPGEAVVLAAGFHSARAERAPASIVLRWGVGLYRPPYQPVRAPLFVPFNGRPGEPAGL